MKNSYANSGLYLSRIFTCNTHPAKTASLAILCIFYIPVVVSMEELPPPDETDQDAWRYSIAIPEENINRLVATLPIFEGKSTAAADSSRPNDRDNDRATLQSSSEFYVSPSGSLKLIPDPTLEARVERTWEHIKKICAAHKTPHESLSEFIIIAPHDTSPSYERLAARIMNFKLREENEHALVSCAFYMLNALCTILQPTQTESDGDSMDIEDNDYFKTAFMWLSDAKISLVKRNLLRDKRQSESQAAQTTLAKVALSIGSGGLTEKATQIKSSTKEQPREYDQQTTLLQTAAQELTALTLYCNTYREVSTGSAPFDTGGSNMSNDLILLFDALSDLLRHCIPIQERSSAAEELCLELAELLINLADQRPELMNLDLVDVTDLHTNSFLRFLFERKTALMLHACTTYLSKSDTAHPGKSFSLLLPVLRNKKMLIALHAVETPYQEEDTGHPTAGENTNQLKEKDEAPPESRDSSTDTLEQEIRRDATIETTEKLEAEYNALKQKMIHIIKHTSEISIHDILKLDHLLSDNEIVSHILQKAEIETTDQSCPTDEAHGIFQVGPLLMRMRNLCTALSKLRQLNKSETTLKPLILKRGELAKNLLELFHKDDQLMEKIFSAMPKVEHSHHADTQKIVCASLPIFLAVPELHTIPILGLLVEKFRKERDAHGTDLLMILFEKALTLIELIDFLPKKDLLDTISKEALAELLQHAQSEKELDRAKIAFQLVKAEQIAQARRDLDTLALAIKNLIEKEPNLVNMGLLNLPAFKHNKHALLLLAKKLMTQVDDGSNRTADAEKLVYCFVEVGKSISLAVQSRYAVAQKQIGKKAKSERMKAQAQIILATLPAQIAELERSYRETLGGIESIAEGNGTIVQALNEYVEPLSSASLKATLDSLEASCKKQGSLPGAHFIEKLRGWQGNAPELLNCGPLCDRENAAECKAFALLINDYLNTLNKEIDEKKAQRAEAQHNHELHTMRIENYTATLAETAAAQEQAAIDLQEIAGALHALHTAFPQAVSPEILVEYPIPNDSWWSWWNYTPLAFCVVM